MNYEKFYILIGSAIMGGICLVTYTAQVLTLHIQNNSKLGAGCKKKKNVFLKTIKKERKRERENQIFQKISPELDTCMQIALCVRKGRLFSM